MRVSGEGISLYSRRGRRFKIRAKKGKIRAAPPGAMGKSRSHRGRYRVSPKLASRLFSEERYTTVGKYQIKRRGN